MEGKGLGNENPIRLYSSLRAAFLMHTDRWLVCQQIAFLAEVLDGDGPVLYYLESVWF